MEDKLAQRLVTKIVSGDTARYEDIIETHYRSMYGACLRLVHDSTLAEKYASLTFIRAFENLPNFLKAKKELFTWLLGQLKESLKDGLKRKDWEATPFARGQEIYSDPVWVPALRDELLEGEHRASMEDLRRLSKTLKSAHLLLLEIHFIDGVTLQDLAELFDVSVTILRSFLFGLFDVLGSLSDLSHTDTCDPDLFLGLSTLLIRGDPEKLRGLMDEHTKCKGCGEVIARTDRIARLLSLDSRPRAKAAAVLMARILTVPQKMRTKKVYTYVPIRKTVDKPASNTTHLWTPVILLLLFTLAAWQMLEGNIRGRQSRQSQAAIARASAGKNAAAKFERQRLGVSRDRRGLAQTFYKNAELRAPMHSGLSIEYDNGGSMKLSPGSAVQAGENHVTLVNGSMFLSAPLSNRDLFSVYASKIIAKTKGGRLLVVNRPGAETLLAVQHGEAQVIMPSGQSITVSANRQVRVQLNGSFTIEDLTPGSYGDAIGGSGNAISGSGAAASGRGTPGGGNSGQNLGLGSNPRSGTRRTGTRRSSPNRAQPFRGVRGYRHYF